MWVRGWAEVSEAGPLLLTCWPAVASLLALWWPAAFVLRMSWSYCNTVL